MGLLWSIKQSNPSAYEVTQICYHFEYLTILAVAKQPWLFYHSNYCKYQNVFVLKICLGLIWSIIEVTFLATCTLGLLWLLLGFTLIRFLDDKTVWNTFKVQNSDYLVIFLQLYAVKTYTGTVQKIYYQKLLTFSVPLPWFKSVLFLCKCKLASNLL